jgi:hypothetical protein
MIKQFRRKDAVNLVFKTSDPEREHIYAENIDIPIDAGSSHKQIINYGTILS